MRCPSATTPSARLRARSGTTLPLRRGEVRRPGLVFVSGRAASRPLVLGSSRIPSRFQCHSTGVRHGSLHLLRLIHLSLIAEYDLYQATIYANTKDEYFTFTTPAAKKAINDYLQYRERCGEKTNKIYALIRQQFDGADSLAVDTQKHYILRVLKTL